MSDDCWRREHYKGIRNDGKMEESKKEMGRVKKGEEE